MALGQGDALPKVAVKVMGEKGPEDLNIGEFAADKKVVIFAVPARLRQLQRSALAWLCR